MLVERWPTERFYLILVVTASLLIWALLAISLIGILYAWVLVMFVFWTHLLFVTHLRGSGVKLGPKQFPELHQRVQELARRAGVDPVPDAYVMQAGGSLNALATRFLRTHMIVLFSDLLEACEDDEAARDMIIGHELGHIKAGHLRWLSLIMPGMLVPFLGAAYSRARERTCDRYGVALSGDPRGALVGMTVLAAGGRLGRGVDPAAFVQQHEDLDGGWMTLGRWLSMYPPLCERVAAIDASLAAGRSGRLRGPARAMGILAAMIVVPIAVSTILIAALGLLRAPAEDMTETRAAQQGIAAARAIVDADFARLLDVAKEYHALTGKPPFDAATLYGHWRSQKNEVPPMDPFDEREYGYYLENDEVWLYSSGPDAVADTDDDISIRWTPSE